MASIKYSRLLNEFMNVKGRSNGISSHTLFILYYLSFVVLWGLFLPCHHAETQFCPLQRVNNIFSMTRVSA